jgi:hypothetical protein
MKESDAFKSKVKAKAAKPDQQQAFASSFSRRRSSYDCHGELPGQDEPQQELWRSRSRRLSKGVALFVLVLLLLLCTR